ncbi:hypothetical protein J19TS2_13820 [Cohnella xylanilytica]|uniref:YqhR family membrane protein n=1 Tax=Cohnella xylanilytica TaxID=557555 RepID=UPI001B19C58A|nr:YqhR family membrane protein [Cohnella xylanilytica]GIO11827.1 hypothetical protein J19TS2_13820 [Cohnella xylanilytica]
MPGEKEESAGRRGSDGGEEGAKRRRGESIHPAAYSAIVGFFAGVFLGFIRWFATGINFTKIPQAFLADPFVRRSALGSAGWQWIGLALFIAMSVVASLIYWLALGRLRGPWPGLFFGAAWWALLLFVVGPPTGAVEAPRLLGWNSIVTELCLYLIWGMFIGYSIAFEYHDEAAREPLVKRLSAAGKPQPSP